MEDSIKEESKKIRISEIFDQTENEQRRVAMILRKAHAPKVPVLLIVDKKSFIPIKTKVYICDPNQTIRGLMIAMRKATTLSADQGLFYFIGNRVLMANHTVASLDEDKEDFLRITVARESVFGKFFKDTSEILNQVEKKMSQLKCTHDTYNN
jgi:hypothetical protein